MGIPKQNTSKSVPNLGHPPMPIKSESEYRQTHVRFHLHSNECGKCYFYVPNFEEVAEAYWFGSVRPSVRLCFTLALGQEPIEIGS